jgi:hypothetical protein
MMSRNKKNRFRVISYSRNQNPPQLLLARDLARAQSSLLSIFTVLYIEIASTAAAANPTKAHARMQSKVQQNLVWAIFFSL